MAILTEDEYKEAIKNKVGDSTDDADIEFIENMTDTYNDMLAKTNNNEADLWKRKYEDLQTKYKERFFSSNPNPIAEDDEEDKPHILTFDELFKEN